jgi:hypothetical protein
MASRTSGTSAASERRSESHAERVFEVSRHAKTEPRSEKPFERFWARRHDPADKEYLVESNEYERALLKFVAAKKGMSVKALVRYYAREAALREAMDEDPFR